MTNGGGGIPLSISSAEIPLPHINVTYHVLLSISLDTSPLGSRNLQEICPLIAKSYHFDPSTPRPPAKSPLPLLSGSAQR